MIGSAKAARFLERTKEALFPPPERASREADQRQAAAFRAWSDDFLPFEPLIEGADVLVLGAGDGVLCAALAQSLGARSVIGLGRSPGAEEVEPAQVGLEDGLDIVALVGSDAIDVILCASLEGVTPFGELEGMLRAAYSALRPGGEWLVHVGCAEGAGGGFSGPGYGLMTPSTWALLFLRSGFEIADARPQWRSDHSERAIAKALPETSESERLCGRLGFKLFRPWERHELQELSQ